MHICDPYLNTILTSHYRTVKDASHGCITDSLE